MASTPGLPDQIIEALDTSVFDGNDSRFLPRGCAEELVSKHTQYNITKILQKYIKKGNTVKPDGPIMDFILTRAKTVFLILVHTALFGEQLMKVMKLFEYNSISDDELPVTKELLDTLTKTQHLSLGDDDITSTTASTEYYIPDSDEEDGAFWTSNMSRTFCEKQWKFLAPVFSMNTVNLDLRQRSILPVIEREELARGSFGAVSKCKIHRSHLLGLEEAEALSASPYVAIKEIITTGPKQYQWMADGWSKEVDVLRKMNWLNEPHIVKFVTAFRREYSNYHKHYLVMEFASGGNLRQFWEQTHRPQLTAELVKASVQQLQGLANAIKRAHDPETGPKFRHGDLKPENILWFKDQGIANSPFGTLKIGDWGLAKQHAEVTELRTYNTTTPPGTRLYEPPEEITGEGVHQKSLKVQGATIKRRSRLCDIWALGCITLEFLIWLLYGNSGLQSFIRSLRAKLDDNSRFFQIKQEGNKRLVAQVHDVAVAWMGHMARDPACEVGQTALGDLLELVQKRLLVVKLPQRLATMRSDAAMKIPATPRHMQPHANHEKVNEPLMRDDRLAGTAEQTQHSTDFTFVVDAASSAPPSTVVHKNAHDPAIQPLSGGAERAQASAFHDHMLTISLNDHEETYWFAHQPGSPPDATPRKKHGDTTGDANDRSAQYLGAIAQDVTSLYVTGTRRVRSDHQQGRIPGISLFLKRTRKADMDFSHLTRFWYVNHFSNRRSKTELTSTDHLGMQQELPTEWDVTIDDELTMRLLACPSSQLISSCTISQPPKLCEKCEALQNDLWHPFSESYDVQSLQENSKAPCCPLCNFFFQVWTARVADRSPSILIERRGPRLSMNGAEVMSIYRSPASKTTIDKEIPIGFPSLSAADSAMFFELIHQWLELCDKHPACEPDPTRNVSRETNRPTKLPKRVIDVGQDGNGKVFLRETHDDEKGEWLALSHQWGEKGIHNRFCTTTKNRPNHLRGIGMDYNTLPPTFKDAVTVTRALNKLALKHRYLWIDSVCIIQEGTEADFQEQAKRMEQVYSNAYCVLASSRAPGHFAGFLQDRVERAAITLYHKSDPFYLCENIDNFQGHVLNGSLHQRGWVLQEHALARRTVYFTDHQTYFECGEGVRCETMAKMTNGLASFLSDANFPKSIARADQGEKILRYQDLFKKYSRLGLSQPTDRPVAIESLQKRILKTLNALGDFGIFDEGFKGGSSGGFLRRSLLWCRDQDSSSTLSPINFTVGRTSSVPPSWSWMAYTGPIEYISPDLGGTKWENVQSPWSGGVSATYSEQQGGNLTLLAEARRYDTRKGGAVLIFDCPGGSALSATMCVVLGREYGEKVSPKFKKHYVLIVMEKKAQDKAGRRVCVRVGAGWLLGECIAPQGTPVSIS